MSNESFPRASEGQGEQEEVIICQGKGFCSSSLPAFIFNSGSLCRHFFFFFPNSLFLLCQKLHISGKMFITG